MRIAQARASLARGQGAAEASSTERLLQNTERLLQNTERLLEDCSTLHVEEGKHGHTRHAQAHARDSRRQHVVEHPLLVPAASPAPRFQTPQHPCCKTRNPWRACKLSSRLPPLQTVADCRACKLCGRAGVCAGPRPPRTPGGGQRAAR